MALLHESVEKKKFDTRVVEKNMARGVISAPELDKVLASLPDDAENADWVSLDTLIDEEAKTSQH